MNTNALKPLAILPTAAILILVSGRVANESIELIVEKPGLCTRRSTECATRSCRTLLDAIREAERTIEFATYGMARGRSHPGRVARSKRPGGRGARGRG